MNIRVEQTIVEKIIDDLERTWHRIDSDMSIKMQEALSILKDVMGYRYEEKAVAAWDNGDLVGVAVYETIKDVNLGTQDTHISELASFTHVSGVGLALIDKVVEIAKGDGSDAVTASYAPGYREFYERMGFIKDYRNPISPTLMMRKLKSSGPLDLNELLAPDWRVTIRTTLYTPQWVLRTGQEVPRYVYHVPDGKADFGRVVKAYPIREVEAADMFGPGYKKAKYVWLSLKPSFGMNNTYIIDLSRLDNESLRLTGQIEGHLLHQGDIPPDAVVAVMRNGQVVIKP